MANRLPPDHDPGLRRAFALDENGQRALLHSMATGTHFAPGSVGVPMFRHVGLKVRRTQRGALSCAPLPFGDVILSANSTQLHILIDHVRFQSGRSAPRTLKTIAEMEALLATHAPNRGVATLPFVQPRTWTVQTVRAAIDAMISRLPKEKSYFAGVTLAAGCRRHDTIAVRPYGESESPYSAEVHLAPNATEATKQWRELFTNYWGGGTLELIDEQLGTLEPSSDGANDNDDTDNDLDMIERAARRTLHGTSVSASPNMRGEISRVVADCLVRIADILRREGGNWVN